MTDSELSLAAYRARQLADELNASFWVQHHAAGREAYHVSAARAEFVKLAAAMGYTVAPASQVET